MPNLNELIKRAQYLVDDKTFDPDTIIMFFNEALEDLSFVAAYEKKTTLDVTGRTFNVPSDFISPFALIVTDSRGNSEKIKHTHIAHELAMGLDDRVYTLYGDSGELASELASDEQAMLYYRARLPFLPNTASDPSLSTIPKLPEHFHKMLPLYVAVKYYENWEANPEARSNFERQYLDQKQLLAVQAQNQMYKRTRSRKVEVTRRWS